MTAGVVVGVDGHDLELVVQAHVGLRAVRLRHLDLVLGAVLAVQLDVARLATGPGGSSVTRARRVSRADGS